MKKILLAIACLSMATPVVADIRTDRVQIIYDTSRAVCPTVVRLAKQGQDSDKLLDALVETAQKQGYTDEEVALLLMLCNSYMQGMIDKPTA